MSHAITGSGRDSTAAALTALTVLSGLLARAGLAARPAGVPGQPTLVVTNPAAPTVTATVTVNGTDYIAFDGIVLGPVAGPDQACTRLAHLLAAQVGN